VTSAAYGDQLLKTLLRTCEDFIQSRSDVGEYGENGEKLTEVHSFADALEYAYVAEGYSESEAMAKAIEQLKGLRKKYSPHLINATYRKTSQ
jgi:hypothetical protein